MTGNELRELLKAGKRAYGTLIVGDSPKWFGAVKGIGLDYVFIDLEHIALERKDLSWMCQGYRAMGIPPVVRIPDHDPNKATMALDAGACGILAPYIEEKSQVDALIQAVKYRPLKGEKARNIVESGAELSEKMRDYLNEFNKDHLLFINIESKRGVDNLEALVSSSDVDGIIIGPHDLSCSYEMPEEYDSPEFEELVTSIITRARELGTSAGIHQTWDDLELAERWIGAGANIVLQKADIICFVEKISSDLNRFKAKFEGAGTGSRDNINI